MINIIQEKSDVIVFNTIADYAKHKNKDYRISFFKRRIFNIRKMIKSELLEDEYSYLDYLQIHLNNNQILSIYFDKEDAGAIMDQQYYELYYGGDITRYYIDEELKLYNDVTQILNKKNK